MKSIVSIRYLKRQLQEAAATKIQNAYRAHFFRVEVLQFGDINQQAYCVESDDSADQSLTESYMSYGTCKFCDDEGQKSLYYYSCEDSGSIYC